MQFMCWEVVSEKESKDYLSVCLRKWEMNLGVETVYWPTQTDPQELCFFHQVLNLAYICILWNFESGWQVKAIAFEACNSWCVFGSVCGVLVFVKQGFTT